MTTATKLPLIEEKIKAYKNTLTSIEITPIRDIALMMGTRPIAYVNDSIWPIAEFKREYMRRLKYRILELESINQSSEAK
jgi:hypothetical protein